MAKKQLTYEEAMTRLEQLTSDMENNRLNIDQLSEALKEAQSLIKQCRQKLYQADEQVKKILEETEE